MLPQIVIDLTGIQRFFMQPQDVLLFEILGPVAVILFLSVIFWGISEIYLDKLQDKFDAKQKHIVLAIDIPGMSEQGPKAVENLFAVVKGTKSNVTMKEKWIIGKNLGKTSFEIVSINGYIQFFLRINQKFRDLFEAAIYSQYPDAEISEVGDYTEILPTEYPDETLDLFGGEIVMKQPKYFPLRTYLDFEDMTSKDQKFKDPLIGMLENMSRLKHGEQFWIHIMVYPDGGDDVLKEGEEFILKTYGKDLPKSKSTMEKILGPVAWLPKEAVGQLEGLWNAASGGDEKSKTDQFKLFNMTPTEKSQLDAVSRKLMKPGYPCKIRWAYIGKRELFQKGARNSLWKGYIALYTNPYGNNFGYDPATMPRDDYFYMRWEYNRKQRILAQALKDRDFTVGSAPMYLNLEELATLWHFPSVEVKAPLIKKVESKMSEAPVSLPTAEFGESDELTSFALIEVDADGNPIESVDNIDSGDVVGDSVGDVGIADILPTGPLVEVGQDDEKDEIDQPFIPPNLPV